MASPIADTGSGIAQEDDGIAVEDNGQDFRRLRVRRDRGLGWTPDLPDLRDFTLDSPQIQRSPLIRSTMAPLKTTPPRVDLRPAFSPVEQQGSLGSCTAQAYAGLLEYYERRALRRHVEASRLFLYKVTRKLLRWTGDTGAYLRTTMQTAALFGLPPEEHYPYVISKFDLEPEAYVYGLAQNWQATMYARLDPAGSDGDTALANLKNRLALQQPAMFGFTVYSSMPYQSSTGIIPYPTDSDRVDGGHAVVAAGYDDTKIIDGVPGAILIRNSWGPGWGERGYGWLGYRWFTQRLAVDIWTLTRSEYTDLAPFT